MHIGFSHEHMFKTVAIFAVGLLIAFINLESWPDYGNVILTAYLACLHDQNKSGFFGELAFIQQIRAI